MRAAYIEEFGSADIIQYGELPAPSTGPSDVLVDVTATTVNVVDTFVRSGALRTSPLGFPLVTGRDLVGTVARVGPAAAGFAVGDRVWCNSLGHEGRQGAAAEQAAVAADRLYHLPDGVDPHTAVAMLHPGTLAHLALFTHGRLRPGETVVVTGAGHDIGRALVAFAAQAGAHVIATAPAHDAGHGTIRGAAEVLDEGDPDLVRKLRGAGPTGVDLYLDTSGLTGLAGVVTLLARRGRGILLAGALAQPFVPASALDMTDCSVAGFAISHVPCAELAECAVAVNRMLTAGLLQPRATEVLPLSATADVHRRLEKGDLHPLRVVLRPDHPAGR